MPSLLCRRTFLSRLAALPILAGPCAGLAALAGCSEAGSLAVGMHPWPGYETLRLAREFGWLPNYVRLIEWRNSTETQAGLQAGTLDAGCLTLDEVLLARAEGAPLTVIAVLDESVGADVVLAKPEIRTLADLAGKRIAVEKTAVGGLMLVKLLQAAALDRSAVTLVDLPPDQQAEAWRGQRIDAAVCYEPVASQLETLGGQRLFDSRQIPGTIFDVLAVRRDRLAGRSASLEALVSAHFRAVDHLILSREDALRRIGAWRRQSFAEVAASFAGLNLPDAAGNRRMFLPDGRLARAARGLADVMLANGLLTQRGDLEGLFEPRFLPGLPG